MPTTATAPTHSMRHECSSPAAVCQPSFLSPEAAAGAFPGSKGFAAQPLALASAALSAGVLPAPLAVLFDGVLWSCPLILSFGDVLQCAKPVYCLTQHGGLFKPVQECMSLLRIWYSEMPGALVMAARSTLPLPCQGTT